MCRCPIVLGLLALMACLSASSAEEPTLGEDLFPLSIGNSWTYLIQGQEDRFIVKATQMENVGPRPCIKLEGKLRNQLIATEHLSIRKDGVYRMRNDLADIEPPLLICKFPPVKGETWKIDYKVGDKKATIVYDSGMELIEVPAGKYQTVVIHSEVPEGAGKLKNTCWYAPKIGLVKQRIEHEDSKIVLELEKFEKK